MPIQRSPNSASPPSQHRSARPGWIAVLMIAGTGVVRGAEPEMPPGFVYLHDADPSILQDIRYAGSANFTRHELAGYNAGECLLARPAAEALKQAQQDV